MQSPGQKIFSLYTQWKDGELPGKTWLSQVSRWIMGVASIDSSIAVNYTLWNINLQISQDWIDNTQSIPVAAKIKEVNLSGKYMMVDLYRDGIYNDPRDTEFYKDKDIKVYLRDDIPFKPTSKIIDKFIWVIQKYDPLAVQVPNPKWYTVDQDFESKTYAAKITAVQGDLLICDIYRDGPQNPVRDGDTDKEIHLRDGEDILASVKLIDQFIFVNLFYDNEAYDPEDPTAAEYWYCTDLPTQAAPVIGKINSFSGQYLNCDLYRDGFNEPVRTGDAGVQVKTPHTIGTDNKLSGLYVWVFPNYDNINDSPTYSTIDNPKVVDFGTIVDADAIDLAPEIAINNGYLQVRCKKIRFKIDDSTTPPQLKIFKTTVDGTWSTGIQVGTC